MPLLDIETSQTGAANLENEARGVLKAVLISSSLQPLAEGFWGDLAEAEAYEWGSAIVSHQHGLLN